MDEAEFLAQATGIVNHLEAGVLRVHPADRGNWRALEIGCGSGRVMRPMSRHFVEIHGMDASPVRASDARKHLKDIPNARIHVPEDGRFPGLEGEWFDFLYSVEAGFEAWPWIERHLRDGGLARLRFRAAEVTRADVLEFAAAHDLQVLAVDRSAQSTWTTWRKRGPGWSASLATPAANASIRRITNAYSNEPVAPCRGRFASIAIRAENLPPDAGLRHLRVTIGSSLGTLTSVGEPDRSGTALLHADLPELEATGLLPVQLFWLEQVLCDPVSLRVIPPGPSVPRLTSVHARPGTRAVTIVVEEIARPHELEVAVGGHAVAGLEYVCTDPRSQCYEVTFDLPEQVGAGLHQTEVRMGHRKLPPVPVVAGGAI